MYVLGHLGLGLGIAWLATSRRPGTVDYRLVLFGALLPDLIDKPLGALLDLDARLWAHTLFFVGVVLAASAVPRARLLFSVGIGILTHLLLDRIWEQPSVGLWAALGWSFPPGGPAPRGVLQA